MADWTTPNLAASLIKLCRVGGDCKLNSTANLAIFSCGVLEKSQIVNKQLTSRKQNINKQLKVLPISFDKLVKLRMITRNRHGQDGAQDPGCQLAQLLSTDILLHLPGQLEVLEDGSSMKQLISALPEDKCQFLVVIRHHLGLEDFFAQDHEAMDILK